MILSQEQWMELRAFKALADAGATWGRNEPEGFRGAEHQREPRAAV
jgi:hypothetical protein